MHWNRSGVFHDEVEILTVSEIYEVPVGIYVVSDL